MVRSIGFDVVPCLVAWDGNGSFWPILLQKSAGSVGAIFLRSCICPSKSTWQSTPPAAQPEEHKHGAATSGGTQDRLLPASVPRPKMIAGGRRAAGKIDGIRGCAPLAL
jgi:hypothetical protein